ncbi:19238_t:CDS:2, partial [Gigaspora margarita]
DNETVVEDYKKSVEVENVCNKLWEERVAALVGKRKKKIFQSQEALDEACEAWLEKDSSSQLAVSILKDEEETETIRGLQIRTSGHLRLRNIEANLKFWRNFKLLNYYSPAYLNYYSPDYVVKISDPYRNQWK